MSRSGYSDDIDNWDLIRWRGQVASAIRGKRGQKMLRDLLAALDSMPEKRLIADGMVDACGVCTLGALGQARGMDLFRLDQENASEVAAMFDIAKPLAKEIMFENDEAFYFNETPEHRWARMRAWVAQQITEPNAGEAPCPAKSA